MKQITESYVSYEIAKLLKEKGFDEYCGTAYTTAEGYPIRVMGSTYSLERNSDYDNLHYSMPSQSLALKWLREVHKLFVKVNYTTHPITKDKNYYGSVINMEDVRETVLAFEDALTYEGCVNSLLKYALEKLI